MQKSWFLHKNCSLHTLEKLTEWDHCRRDCVEISCRTSVLSVASPFLFFRPNAHTRTMTSTRGEKDFQKEASGKRTKFLDIYLKSMTSNLYSVSYVCVINNTYSDAWLKVMPANVGDKVSVYISQPVPWDNRVQIYLGLFQVLGGHFSYLTQKGV